MPKIRHENEKVAMLSLTVSDTLEEDIHGCFVNPPPSCFTEGRRSAFISLCLFTPNLFFFCVLQGSPVEMMNEPMGFGRM